MSKGSMFGQMLLAALMMALMVVGAIVLAGKAMSCDTTVLDTPVTRAAQAGYQDGSGKHC